MPPASSHTSKAPARPTFTVADLVRRYRKPLLTAHAQSVTQPAEGYDKAEPNHWLSLPQRRLLGAMAACRTASLGGHLHHCPACAQHHVVYHSCRKRGCTTCQGLAQQRWVAAMQARLLPVPHFHVIATLPSELRPLALAQPEEVYEAFFQSVASMLAWIGQRRIRGTLGWTLVLHTWARNLGIHPHIHAMVTAGGLSFDGSRFRTIREPYLYEGEALGRILRQAMLQILQQQRDTGLYALQSDATWIGLMVSLEAHESWVVHVRPAIQKSKTLLGYLGAYIHRMAISDRRLVSVDETQVTFTTRHGKTARLDPLTFLRRFLQHVLPPGFHKVRHGGLYGSSRKREQARALIQPHVPTRIHTCKTPQPRPPRCPSCGGPMERVLPAPPQDRSPPGEPHA